MRNPLKYCTFMISQVKCVFLISSYKLGPAAQRRPSELKSVVVKEMPENMVSIRASLSVPKHL